MKELYQHQYFEGGGFSKAKTSDYIAQGIEITKDTRGLCGNKRPYTIYQFTSNSERNRSGISLQVDKEGLLVLQKLLTAFIKKEAKDEKKKRNNNA